MSEPSVREHLGLDPWEVRPANWRGRLNIGAGGDAMPAWTNHDKIVHSPQIDVACDLDSIPWTPFQDNQFSRVYAWAVLEHIRPTLQESMDELWRILRPGGKVHIKVPQWDYYKAYRDPTHIWRGWDIGVWTFFDPATGNGANSHYYSPRKWRLLERGYTDKRKVAIWAKLQKVCSEDQWEDVMNGGLKVAEPKRIIWINGRSGAGKSTLCRYLQSLYPNIIVVDDHYLWRDVWRHTYNKLSGIKTAQPGVDLFDDERPESMHRDFSTECALVAKSLARQGHRVIVDMIASPQKRRERIDLTCNPYWVYVKREQGEVRTPRFDPMPGFDFMADHDLWTKQKSAAKLAKHLVENGLLP